MWRKESERHSLSSRGVRTKPKYLNFQIWSNGSLSSTYLILEILTTYGPTFQKDIIADTNYFGVSAIALRDAIERLEEKELIKLTKEIAPSGRQAYLVSITPKGWSEFKEAKARWSEIVAKNTIMTTYEPK